MLNFKNLPKLPDEKVEKSFLPYERLQKIEERDDILNDCFFCGYQ